MASRKGAGTPNKLDDPDVYDPGHFSGGPSTSRGSRARPSPNPRWSTVNGRAVMREPSPELPADEEEPEYDYPGNNFSTPVLEPRTLAQSGPKKAQDEELPIYVRGLPGDRSLSAFDVYKFFSRVGKVGSVRLNKFASSRPSRIGEPRQPSTRDCVVYFETCNPKFSSPMLNREAKRMDFPYNGKHYDISVNLDRKYTPRKDIVRPIEPGQNPYFPEDELVLKGFALGNYISPDKFYEQWESTVEARMVIEYEDNTSVSIIWSPSVTVDYKIEYKFKHIRESFKLNRLVENNVVKYDIGASLTMAPFVYYRKKDKYNFSVASRGEWRRIAFDKLTSLQVFPTDIFYKGMENLQAIVAEVPNTGTLIDHHYKVEFPLVENGVSDQENYFLSVLGHLEQYGLVLHVHRFGHVDYIPREDVPPPFDVLQSQLPYPIKFKLISLISFNNITPYHIDDEFVKLLQKVSSEIAEGVLEQMMKPKERIWDPKEVLREQLKDTESVEQRIQRNETLNYNQRMIRKIIITPTRILYHGPQLELANRILRTYRVHHDKFLRVSFCDDDLLPLPVHNFDGKNDLPFRRIEAILQTGMDICGMKVEFLHYSNSSLRTGGSWFLSPFSRDGDGRTVNADYIQRTIGTFKETTNPALRGARMAQCFSSTTVTGKIAEAMIKEVPDVERNGFCFSDGVGRIGKTIAYNTFGELRKYMRTREGMPSAYQFRMAGAKGVLTLDETIPPNEIHLRPSQIKFMSKHFAVEVCRTSFHSPGYLNHQFVILLESLGISQKVFLELRDESIRELDRALVVPEEAIRVLSENADGEGTSHVLVAMIKSGLFTVKEPFLMNLLGLFRALQLRDIKTRAKILVKDSASLIGVMDETGLLKHDQLFLQFTDPVTQSKKIIKGKIAIMRAPALHPGDVQVVECVDIPELHHLFDVIVFSQHGERPLPNMLSGGDLDGDTFFVTWDERLIPEKSAQPMEYSTKLVVSLEDSTVDNVKKHFVHYMRHNNLGSIDNAWKAWADKSPKGAFDETAMKLATLHSDAVDFAKKGVPAFMDRELRPRSWPDFMEKPAYQSSYQSNKAVGEIYRSVHVDLKLLKDFQPFEEFKYPGYEKYLEDARVTKLAYDRQICAVMNQYEIKSEFELVSGFIFHLAPAAVNNRRPHEAREVVVAAVQNIKKHYRQLFWTKDMQAVAGAQADKLASGNDEEEGAIVGFDMKLSDAIYAKASAWYMAAYDTTLQPKTSAADTPTDNVEQYPSPAASSPLGSENGDAGAAVPNLSEEEKLAAHRRLATASVRKSEKLYQHIDWDMSGRFYSFPWVVYDVLCNRYRQAQPDTKMTMVTLDDL